MSFTTPSGQVVELDAVEAWTVRPLVRPAPIEQLMERGFSHAQAERELADWAVFPFEVVVEVSGGEIASLFGTEARAFVAAQLAGLAPWLR